MTLSGYMVGVMQVFGPVGTESDPNYYASRSYGRKEGVGGTRCSDTLANIATAYGNYGPPRGVTTNAATIDCGRNDYVGGRTPAQTYADILSIVAYLKARGLSVIVNNMGSASTYDVSDPTWKPALNALIAGGAVANGYTVSDIGADANLGCLGCYSNLTYFLPDGVHLTQTGYNLKGTIVGVRLTALGFN